MGAWELEGLEGEEEEEDSILASSFVWAWDGRSLVGWWRLRFRLSARGRGRMDGWEWDARRRRRRRCRCLRRSLSTLMILFHLLPTRVVHLFFLLLLLLRRARTISFCRPLKTFSWSRPLPVFSFPRERRIFSFPRRRLGKPPLIGNYKMISSFSHAVAAHDLAFSTQYFSLFSSRHGP